MWSPSTDFSYGFASGVSLFLLVELIRCIRMACTRKKDETKTITNEIATYPPQHGPIIPYPYLSQPSAPPAPTLPPSYMIPPSYY